MSGSPEERSARPLSVLVGMGETAGYCARLVEGLRAAGARADHVNLGADPMRYTREAPARLVGVVRWLAMRRRSGGRAGVGWSALHRVAMGVLFIVSVARYDAFVFRAGDSFFALRDLALLRRLGKPVVVVFFGSDSRPSYLNGAEVARGVTGHDAARATARKRRMVARIERHATAIVCHVMSAQLHRRAPVAFLEVGIPRRTEGADRSARRTDGPIRVLHAPSRPDDKGTAAIRAAVDTARGAGTDVELVVVTGRPNDEVLEAIRECDFVIDQLYSDTPMGTFAAEAAALGRPAIVGGYGWNELRHATAPPAMPPAHLCHPDDLAAAVTTLATDASYRRELGARAHAFVRDRWALEQVGRRFLMLLHGETPSDWMFEPNEIIYTHGAGMAEETLVAAVRGVVERDGVAGLNVRDKPSLERRLLELVAPAGVGERA